MICKIISLSDRACIRDITFPVFKKYCEKNNYDIRLDIQSLDTNRYIAWSKILLLISELKEHKDKFQYYIWIDDDILLTDHDKKIHDIINRYDFENILVSKDVMDWCPINSGIIVCKYSEKTISILENIYILGNSTGTIHKHNWEQNAVILYYQQFMLSTKEIVTVPHNILQSFYRDYDITPDNIWKPGHFSAHVTGMGDDKRVLILNHILKMQNA